MIPPIVSIYIYILFNTCSTYISSRVATKGALRESVHVASGVDVTEWTEKDGKTLQ